MPFYEREEKIMKLMKSAKTLSLKEISQKLFVSLPTVRRDLIKLEKKGLIERKHGKAELKINPADTKIPISLRFEEQNSAKSIIAKKAACLVKDGDTIMLDASTSAYCIVPYLANKKNLIVITSGAKTALLLAHYGIHTISTGGHMINKSLSYIGTDAIASIERYNADIAFFSCRGISSNGTVTDTSVEENDIRRAMMRHSKKKILLCDSGKFDNTYLNTLCTTDDTDAVLSENS